MIHLFYYPLDYSIPLIVYFIKYTTIDLFNLSTYLLDQRIPLGQ